MECFKIDESGYTGFNLLDAEQPFQGAAAIAISDDEAALLIKKHFPSLQATELKYTTLARKAKNHPSLLGLIKDILTHYKCVTYVCDKRFLLLLTFLDYAAEPFYFKRGIKFYEDGQNYALASLLYSAGPALLGPAEFNAMLAAFQRAVKEKTIKSLEDLVAAVRATRWQSLPEALGPLAMHKAPECLDAIATLGVSTDAAFVVLQSLISRMEKMTDGQYVIDHDRSKNLLAYNNLIQQYINHKHVIEFRHSRVASLKFPLKLTLVKQVDSKTSPGVQLADVLIGAVIDMTKTLVNQQTNEFDKELLLLLTDENFIHLLPSLDFEEQRLFRQGTQAEEMIDYFASNFHGNCKSV